MSVSENKKIWDDLYENGTRHQNKAPFDEVVAFIYKNKPDKLPHETRILEVGCGVGNNLGFLANQGFTVSGIDFSEHAISDARSKIPPRNEGTVIAGDFTELPFGTGSFDMAFDRNALCYADRDGMKKAIAEVHRVLKPDGVFLFTPFEHHFDKTTGEISFVKATELEEFLPPNWWEIVSVQRVDLWEIHPDNEEWKVSHYRVTAKPLKG